MTVCEGFVRGWLVLQRGCDQRCRAANDSASSGLHKRACHKSSLQNAVSREVLILLRESLLAQLIYRVKNKIGLGNSNLFLIVWIVLSRSSCVDKKAFSVITVNEGIGSETDGATLMLLKLRAICGVLLKKGSNSSFSPCNVFFNIFPSQLGYPQKCALELQGRRHQDIVRRIF